MISYYLNLLDSMATTVVVNARFYWILDTGSGWNEHRDFSLKAEFRQFVRRYPIEATSRLFHPQTFLAPPVRFLTPSSRVVTPQCRFVGSAPAAMCFRMRDSGLCSTTGKTCMRYIVIATSPIRYECPPYGFLRSAEGKGTTLLP
jgi:hypothetical protein